MMIDRRGLARELSETRKSYREAINSNIKLMDEKNWAIDDRDRALRRISDAIEYINATEKIDKEELIEILKDDYEW